MTNKTMAATTSAPFWLEIKTEYIDANLEKVIAYICQQKYGAWQWGQSAHMYQYGCVTEKWI